MISIRSTISRRIIGGRNPTNAAAAFLQANVPFPSSSSSDRSESNGTVRPASVRCLSSPAYRRYIAKMEKTGVRAAKPSIQASTDGIQVPSLIVAQDMGKVYSEMENEPLVVIAEMRNHGARIEVLRRHIMAVDKINYEKAGVTLDKIMAKNREKLFFFSSPYKIGMFSAIVLGLGAFPMVFSVNTALWFNDIYVTMDVPPPSDLDTFLETGAWSWNWMEPILGTASFSLLCFQYIRQQLLNLGMKPYTQKLIEMRANSLCKAFPDYQEHIIYNFVESDPMA